MYISDIITENKIKKWKVGDRILIEAQTGKGKSHFIKYKLATTLTNSKILLLSNRNILKEQNVKEMSDNENIVFHNYQYMEQLISNNNKIESYDIIVADECHYLFNDSSFNQHTDILIDYLFNNSNAIVIFLSATSRTISDYAKNNNIRWSHRPKIKKSYDLIESFYTYVDNDNIVKLLTEIPVDEKAIVFTTAINAHKWSSMFENSEFICGTSSRYRDEVDPTTIQSISENEKFNKQILFSTSGMDNGVNIKDKAVKHIIVDYFDFDTIIQCLGRKRMLDETDKTKVYIKNRFGQSLTKRVNNMSERMDKYNYLMDNGSIEYLNKYNERKNEVGIYNISKDNKVELTVNKMAYSKLKSDLQTYSHLLGVYDGYIKSLARMLKVRFNDIIDLDELYNSKTVDTFLESLYNTKLFDKDKNRIVKWFLVNIFGKNNSNIKLSTINGYLREEKVDSKYRIESKRENARGDNYKKYYWIIVKK